MTDTDRVLAAIYETAAAMADLVLLSSLCARGFVDRKDTGERVDIIQVVSDRQAEWLEKAEALSLDRWNVDRNRTAGVD